MKKSTFRVIVSIISLIGVILPALIYQNFYDITDKPDSNLLDLWSLTHLCVFILAFAIGEMFEKPKKLFYILVILGILWEFIEYGLSYYIPITRAISWETFTNVISDIIVDTIGALIGYFFFRKSEFENKTYYFEKPKR